MPPAGVSLPVRERGLKSTATFEAHAVAHVAPRAGAWIEDPLPS